MKIFSQEQWCDMTCRIVGTPAFNELADVLGTRANPSENQCDMTDTPAGAVCIDTGILDDLKARVDWLWQDDQEGTANKLMDFVDTLERAVPSQSLLAKALVSEGKA